MLLLMASVFCLSGCNDKPVPYRQETHGTFADEFPPHEGVNGWWYVTGYLEDAANPSDVYAFQYTQFNIRKLTRIPVYALQVTVTNLRTGEHFMQFWFGVAGCRVYADADRVSFQPHALLERSNNGMQMTARINRAALDLRFDFAKDAVWHGDEGVLVMGLPEDPVQRTVYYSYTNMPTSGTLRLRQPNGDCKTLTVTGKSWFDRQWGPYRMTDTDASSWEWFSLRFFDNEEVMLFSFPQHPYQDGTYVDAQGNSSRLMEYEYTPTGHIEADGACYSFGWDLTLPGIKEQHYTIEPLTDGQFNLKYFEIMAAIKNDAGETVGYAFVELLPGTREGLCSAVNQ